MPHHCDGKSFVVRADEKLTAFLELEAAIHAARVEFSLLRNPSKSHGLEVVLRKNHMLA
jgi:hypothetical protein